MRFTRTAGALRAIILCAAFVASAGTGLATPVMAQGKVSSNASQTADQDAPRMSVASVVTLGDDTLGQPQRILPAGEEFNFTLGEMGKLQVNIIGRAAPINDRASALDYTIEMEEWVKAGTEVKRTTQTLRMDNGVGVVLGGIRDSKGRELRVTLTVSRPPPR